MAHRIRWLNQALRELYHHCQFLERGSPDRALQLEEEAFRAAEMLEQFSVLGRVVPDVPTEHRCLLIAKRRYWLVYRVRSKTVTIVAVVSTLQDFQKAWESRKRT